MSGATDSILTLTGIESAEIVVSEDYQQVKATALAAAAEVTSVSDAFTADIATDALKQLKAISREVEKTRKAVKEPVLALSRQIDGTAKDFISDLENEASRISRILGAWQAAERERQEKARREAERKEREARWKAEQEIREAQRIASEKAAAAKTEQERDAVEQEIAAKEQAIIEQTAADVQAAREAKIATRSNEPKGTQLRKTLCFEVTDIQALYKSRPECVRLEPQNDMIRALIKHNQNIPGLRVWEEVKTVV